MGAFPLRQCVVLPVQRVVLFIIDGVERFPVFVPCLWKLVGDDGDRLCAEGEMLVFDASGIGYPAVRFVDDCDALYVGLFE